MFIGSMFSGNLTYQNKDFTIKGIPLVIHVPGDRGPIEVRCWPSDWIDCVIIHTKKDGIDVTTFDANGNKAKIFQAKSYQVFKSDNNTVVQINR